MLSRNAINELQRLQYLPRAGNSRETMVEDRTKAHADHVGAGLDRRTTAAVGKNLFFFFLSSHASNKLSIYDS